MSPEPFLRLDHIRRAFEPGDAAAVADLELDVGEHEIVTLLGPSGCGKTTTLRIVAGFETPDAGRVILGGRDVTRVAPQRRGFGMVFQHYALFPHLSVGENIAFGLKGIGTSSAINAKASESLALVGLPGFEERSVASLSGGQQQRVALARALAREPAVLLLDEPLSNLDAALRERTRRELRVLMKEIGITTIYVTHDQEEAFALSDRIAVMDRGRIEQVGLAETLYARPATEFVATFLGRAGHVAGVIESLDGERARCRVSDDVFWEALVGGSTAAPGTRIKLLARPEALRFGSRAAALAGRVVDRRFAGSFYMYRVAVPGGELEVQTRSGDEHVGDSVRVEPVAPPSGIFAFSG